MQEGLGRADVSAIHSRGSGRIEDHGAASDLIIGTGLRSVKLPLAALSRVKQSILRIYKSMYEVLELESRWPPLLQWLLARRSPSGESPCSSWQT